MNSELFKSILAMDAYNRGYGQGIILPDIPGTTQIGNATIYKESDVNIGDPGVSAGFYGIAYTIGGQTIISYRGTDVPMSQDVINGWVAGVPILFNPGNQVPLATDFYRAVIGSADPYTANVSFTGHSLGGGLAGLVASFFGQSATIFDNMPFELATATAYALWGLAGSPLPSVVGITSYATVGEVLAYVRLGIQLPTPIDLYSYGYRNPIDLHSMGLLVNLLYAKQNSLTDWHNIGVQFINSLFNQDVALEAGADSIHGVKADTLHDYADVLRQMVAYSALDEGNVFGNTAIHAMFDDADDLGKAIGKYSSSSSSALKGALQAISNILVQFAGQLANGHVLTNIGDPLLSGVLSLSSDKNTLSINLDPVLWSIGMNSGQPVADIIGRDQILNTLTSTAIDYMGDLWISTNYDLFDHVTFATKDKGITANLLDVPSTGKADLYIGGNGGDSVTGSSGNDLLNGGKGLDYLYGGAGDDIIMGNGGDDTLDGAAGNDYLYGGDGSDVLIGGGDGSDVLVGGGDVDNLYGGAESDTLTGGGDVDNLYGGAESDTLTGGGGNDIFHIDSGDGFDIITDPEAGDSIQFSSGTLSGTASKLGNDIFQLGGYNLRQQGTDLVITKNASAYGSQSATGVTIQNFFTSGYDPKLSYSNIGITIPGTDTPVTNNEKSIVDLNVQAIPGDNMRYCPIVLDLNGDGIKYKSWTSTGYNVHFDIDNDGFAEGMEWLDANDGFLVRDLNGNGKIDNGSELFGEDGGTTAYYKLAQYDTSVTAINTGKGNDVVTVHIAANDNAIDRIYPKRMVG